VRAGVQEEDGMFWGILQSTNESIKRKADCLRVIVGVVDRLDSEIFEDCLVVGCEV